MEMCTKRALPLANSRHSEYRGLECTDLGNSVLGLINRQSLPHNNRYSITKEDYKDGKQIIIFHYRGRFYET